MQVNNAGSLGLEIDGDVLVLHEQFEADVASVSSGEVLYYTTLCSRCQL